ncbi:DUF1345 domain-containing protein [Azorhizobium sp. AG788]|uniref:DUF1345 domain-containing protein n=1 Tax=Azorhizobium sp. AG788 TaxID=2183897 RepID=UPI003139908E
MPDALPPVAPAPNAVGDPADPPARRAHATASTAAASEQGRPKFRTVRATGSTFKPPRFRRRRSGAGPSDGAPTDETEIERSVWRRMLRLHLRLFVGILVALVTFAVSPELAFHTRFLVAWDIGIAVWLVLVMKVVMGGTAERVRRRAAEEDEGALVILIGALLASLFSVAAVVQEAGSVSGAGPYALPHLLLAIGTLTLSWTFMHGIYAMHYAREYYSVSADTHPMLGFPGDEDPDFWDFFYFSFTIGTSAQTADVSVNSRRLRRTVLGHQLVAYVFNASVIALGVNVAASLV